jgi:hypothetical protein
MAWHGMAWHGMAWHGMAWHGMAWHGKARVCQLSSLSLAGPGRCFSGAACNLMLSSSILLFSEGRHDSAWLWRMHALFQLVWPPALRPHNPRAAPPVQDEYSALQYHWPVTVGGTWPRMMPCSFTPLVCSHWGRQKSVELRSCSRFSQAHLHAALSMCGHRHCIAHRVLEDGGASARPLEPQTVQRLLAARCLNGYRPPRPSEAAAPA